MYDMIESHKACPTVCQTHEKWMVCRTKNTFRDRMRDKKFEKKRKMKKESGSKSVCSLELSRVRSKTFISQVCIR